MILKAPKAFDMVITHHWECFQNFLFFLLYRPLELFISNQLMAYRHFLCLVRRNVNFPKIKKDN